VPVDPVSLHGFSYIVCFVSDMNVDQFGAVVRKLSA
jgi:hypothetical protein